VVSNETISKTDYNGENRLITHGILLTYGTFDNLIHEMNEITENDIKREPKKVNWKKTKVFDNFNRGLKIIYQERWK